MYLVLLGEYTGQFVPRLIVSVLFLLVYGLPQLVHTALIIAALFKYLSVCDEGGSLHHECRLAFVRLSYLSCFHAVVADVH